MTEKEVTLDSLSVDAVFAESEIALREFDEDLERFVDLLEKELNYLILDASATLLATQALARRIATIR